MKRKIMSLFLVLVLILSNVSMTAFAQDSNTGSATVSFTAQMEGAFLCAPQMNVQVSADTAERYGYTDKVTDGVSALDVLVKAHEVVFGDDFTPQTASTMLSVNALSSFITTIFGVNTSSYGFAVNGKMPHDNTLIKSEYGDYYTGYTMDAAKVVNGDFAEFFTYRDSYYLDNYVWFEKDSEKITALELKENEELQLSLAGYPIGLVGYNTDEVIKANTQKIPDAQLCLIDAATGAASDITGALTDENGAVKVKFAKEGNYLLSVYMSSEEIEENYAAPIIMPLIPVTVTKAEPLPSEDKPHFDSLEFLTSALNGWVKGETFSPYKLSYDLAIKKATTTSLTMMPTTAYDTEKYIAYAQYTNSNGEEVKIDVNSGKITSLPNIPLDRSVMTITVEDKNDADKKTVYTFNITRPRDTGKALKSNGIEVVPFGRDLSETKYKGFAEGTMFEADETGAAGTKTGVTATRLNYRTYLHNSLDKFSLKISGGTVYTHLRYSTDDGESWKELEQGGGTTDVITAAANVGAKVKIQALDDETYSANVSDGKDGFADSKPTTYTVWAESVAISSESAQILSAQSDGDWYPSFSPEVFEYQIVIANGAAFPTVKYKVPEGASVWVGKNAQTADENGDYSLVLKSSAQTVTVTSSDGNVSNSYVFKALKKSKYDVPDKVVDYLCINSQYTNGAPRDTYGINPENTLAGNLKSLGNFGGYITYYYDTPLTDNPSNPFGVDFFVYGNANADTSSETGLSFFEPGQVWVSENGTDWYALAGSDHYEKGTLWDYSVTYTKASNGKTAWSDNCGNANDGALNSGAWVSAKKYPLNKFAANDTITLSGILLPAYDGSVAASGQGAFASDVKWGYSDCFVNGKLGEAVNPYLANENRSLAANGFDLAWAVDTKGNPVDVSDKAFHYVKVVTASNIWAGAFNEKSTEVSSVIRAAQSESAVGKTDTPSGVTISDGVSQRTINFDGTKNIYSADAGDMKYVSVKVNGTNDDDNIYINKQRVLSGNAAEGFKVTDSSETLVRILVQNGEKEPYISLLKIKGSAQESESVIEGIKVNVNGSGRAAATNDGENYTLKVGHRISSVGIVPIVRSGVEYTINSQSAAESYSLNYGENVFTVSAEGEEAILRITRENVPASSEKNITVSFALYGDSKHGANGTEHTYQKTKSSLETWIAPASYTVAEGSTALDVFERALRSAGLTWVNDGGNYISEINGLAQFDNGQLSGWMYSINGSHPDYGIAEQGVRSGDKIVFHYTDNYTLEEGSERWNTGGGSVSVTPVDKPDKPDETDSAAISNVQKIIDAIGNVTKDSAASIGSARAAYDKLTEKQKAEVSNYDKLLAAEKAYSEIAQGGQTGEHRFSDVDKSSWYSEAVEYVYKNGLFSGVEDTLFAPDDNITRAMFVTVLYRIENEPEASDITFSDVADDAYYKKAVSWASRNGVVYGVSESDFDPDGFITREQIAALLYRYAKIKNQYDMQDKGDLSKFADSGDISDWAYEALSWANGINIIKGSDEGTINSADNATRAEAAALIMRFLSGATGAEK